MDKSGSRIVAVMLCFSLFLGALIGAELGESVVGGLDTAFAAVNGEPSFAPAPIFEPREVTETAETEASQVSESSVSSTASSKKTKEKKLGKIISQFFTPYNANTEYNNVYVNNQSGEKISIKKLLKEGQSPKVEKNESEPQVLIVHTHATENYMAEEKDYYTEADLERTKEENKSVVGVGEKVAEVLKKGGVGVIHDKTLHDDPSYSGSYSRSAVTVEEYLKKYDSIKVVIDIHRDAVASGDDLVKPVTEIEGKKAAQVMICVGSATGSIVEYPKWRQNLAFGVKLQQTLEVLYPGLARALYLAYERSWNQELSTGSIIIEFGTNANTFEEAAYSGELVGEALLTTFNNS